MHGTTYGGNPLACAVAGAVFDVINTTEVLDGVKARHALFMEGLKAINVRRHVFADLRGEGVWLGCELDAHVEGQGDGRRQGRPASPACWCSSPAPTSCASRRRS